MRGHTIELTLRQRRSVRATIVSQTKSWGGRSCTLRCNCGSASIATGKGPTFEHESSIRREACASASREVARCSTSNAKCRNTPLMKPLTRGGCPSGAPTARSRVLPRAPEFKRAFGDFSRASDKLLARRGEHPAPALNALAEKQKNSMRRKRQEVFITNLRNPQIPLHRQPQNSQQLIAPHRRHQ